MKNRYFAALAMAGLVSFAACGADEDVEVDSTVIEADTMAPPITPTPVVVDSGAAVIDTSAAATDTVTP